VKVIIIQGGIDSSLVTGEKTVISNDQKFLSKNCNVTVEYIQK